MWTKPDLYQHSSTDIGMIKALIDKEIANLLAVNAKLGADSPLRGLQEAQIQDLRRLEKTLVPLEDIDAYYFEK